MSIEDNIDQIDKILAKVVEVSLSGIRVLLWGDDRLEEWTIKSRHPGDLAKIRVMPFPIGQRLKELDPEELVFHVELFPESSVSEIWLAFEWKESNARLTRTRANAALNREIKEKKDSRLSKIAQRLKNSGFSAPGFAEHLAKEILENYKKGEFSETLNLLKLTDVIEEIDKEDK